MGFWGGFFFGWLLSGGGESGTPKKRGCLSFIISIFYYSFILSIILGIIIAIVHGCSW